MGYKTACALLTLVMATGSAAAELQVMIAVDPSDRETMVISQYEIQRTLAKVTGQPVQAFKSQDLGDVMRSTRTGEYDVYIAPAHIAASALSHGYTLVGSTEADDIYELVSRPTAKAPTDLRGGKLYLTQQDSVAAYMARGMLNESGQSLKMFQQVLYRNTSGAGLFAIDAMLVDATVAKRPDVQNWIQTKNSNVVVLLTSRPVPGGMSIVVKNDLPETTRVKLDNWFFSPAGAMAGIGRVTYRSSPANYKYVASLGNWTPSQLPGATVVNATEVVALRDKGVPVIDVRIDKEYHEKHIRGAILIPYGEKSLKDVAFDASADTWAGPAKLDPEKPVIFQCNGPECWKSYKAATVALAKGFKKVYWFRGGFPEWESRGLPVESSLSAPAAPTEAIAPVATAPKTGAVR
jgi:rhodanese-related sulfurtransferase/ABC-type phosphate/phosphonate transport system substrate-binding protein